MVFFLLAIYHADFPAPIEVASKGSDDGAVNLWIFKDEGHHHGCFIVGNFLDFYLGDALAFIDFA